MIPSYDYLNNILEELNKKWPENRTINIVCHGHSVPAGYFATPFVNSFSAYPHLLHCLIKERFPYAVINVIVTAIGGESSKSGSERFERDVLPFRPDVVTIDYSLNDRSLGLEEAKKSWKKMIESALEKDSKVILLTPTWDQSYFVQDDNWAQLVDHRNQVINLANEYRVGLADSFLCFENYCKSHGDLTHLLSHVNHPTQKGHELVALELSKYFLAR